MPALLSRPSPDPLSRAPRRFLVVALALAVGCGEPPGGDEPAETASPSSNPTLVMGVDGFEWSVVLPLVRAGRMPHLERMMDRGSYGQLLTMVPTFSPALWTTMATGKPPAEHGIPHFAKKDPTGRLSLFDRRDRRTKALWNLFSDAGRSVHCVGWWLTFPVEEVNGVMVAQTNTIDQVGAPAGRQMWQGSLREGVPAQVHPPELTEAVLGVLETMEESLDPQVDAIFGTMPHDRSVLGEAMWQNCRWAFRADATYVAVARDLALEQGVPDLGLVYIGGTDVTGHRFWRYMQPELYRKAPPAEQVENFGTVIQDYYVYVDDCLGALLEAYGEDTNVFVVADHGMGPVNRGRRFDEDRLPEDVNSGDHQEGPPGVFVCAGPDLRHDPALPPAREVRRQDLPRIGGLLDIAPTVLALHRIPLGEDLRGRVLSALYTPEFAALPQPAPVPTHDDEAFERSRRAILQGPRSDEDERLQQLQQLGYLRELLSESDADKAAREAAGEAARETDGG